MYSKTSMWYGRASQVCHMGNQVPDCDQDVGKM